MLEFDIQALFDRIDHGLLLRAVRKHCAVPWVLLYIERWLKAPMVLGDGTEVARERGTPQGGVVSPLLANLFLHYALDAWVRRELRSVRLCRYADDGVIHCKSEAQARLALDRLGRRLKECGLELHPGKTRIVYCQDINRQEAHPNIQFTFLGYTFRPRKAVDKYGRVYVNFSPAVSRDALRSMRQRVRSWHLQLKCDKELSDLSTIFAPRPSRLGELLRSILCLGAESVVETRQRVSDSLDAAKVQAPAPPQVTGRAAAFQTRSL